jgi:site-specific recombinase XerC
VIGKRNERHPPWCYIKKNRWVYVPYLGNGKREKEVTIGPASMPIEKVWVWYSEVANASSQGTLDGLSQSYQASEEFKTLKPVTMKKYAAGLAALLDRVLRNGQRLGSVEPDAVTPKLLTQYLRKQRHRQIAANRELAALSAMYSWALAWDRVQKNPVKSVRRNKEAPRDCYVTDAEYQAVYDLATAQLYIRPAMELAVLARMRKVEILALNESHKLEDGLLVQRRKGSKTQVVTWTPRLRAAIDAWLETGAGRISDDGFHSSWGRLMTKAVAMGGEAFHLPRSEGERSIRFQRG